MGRGIWWAALLVGCVAGEGQNRRDANTRAASSACTPTSCFELGANCGEAPDGCGGTLDCGRCQWLQSCGAGGVANVCDCAPATCGSIAVECGVVPDGCGGTLDCGGCAGDALCGGDGRPNACGVAARSRDPVCSVDGWCREPVGAPTDFVLSVHGVADEVWLLTRGPFAYRWTGGALEPHRVPERLVDVWSAAKGDAWGVSEHAIWHWDGVRWRESVRADNPLSRVFGVARERVWVAGDHSLFEYDGRAWTRRPGPFGRVRSLWAAGSGDVWVLGDSGWPVHWDGSAWSSPPLPPKPPGPGTSSWELSALAGRTANDVWLLGDRGFPHWDGSAWSVRAALPVGTLAPRDATGLVATGAAIHEWNGTAWSSRPAPFSHWMAFAPRDSDDLWIVGDSERHEIARWDGSAWLTILAPPPKPSGFHAASATDAWALESRGDGGWLHRWDGATWTTSKLPVEGHARLVAGLPSGHRWVIASGWRSSDDSTFEGPFEELHVWNGAAWREVASVRSLGLYREAWFTHVMPRAPDDLWLFAMYRYDDEAPTLWLFHWDGAAWTQQPFPGTDPMLSFGWSWFDFAPDEVRIGERRWNPLAGTFERDEWTDRLAWRPFALRGSREARWLVGGVGQPLASATLRWDGGEWRAEPTGTWGYLGSLHFVRPDLMWAAGQEGVVLRWDGRRWHREATPTHTNLAVHGAGEAVWAIGDDGTVLRKR